MGIGIGMGLGMSGGGSGGASLPTLAFANAVSQAEGASGTTAFTFTLSLARNGSTAVIPFTWAVVGSGSAPASASDFAGGVLPSGGGSFGVGETTKTIVVNVAGDSTVEPDEGFTIAAIASLPLAPASAAGVIINDDVAPVNRTQNIASAGRVPGYEVGNFSLSSGTDTTHRSTKWMVNDSGSARANLAPVFVGWYTDVGAGAEVNIGGALTITASVEYPIGTRTPLTFGGSPTGTVNPGGMLIADTLAIAVPAGALFGVRVFMTCASGVKFPGAAKALSNTGAALSDEAESGASLTDNTLTGGTGSTANYGYFPVAVLSTGPTTSFRPVCLALVGDSIVVAAASASYDSAQNRGGMGRAATGKAPLIHMAVTGTKAADSAASGMFARRLALMQACGVTHALVDYATNDLQAGTGLAGTQASVTTLMTAIANAGIKPIGMTVLPRQAAVGADKGETIAGQIINTTGAFTVGAGSVRAQYNGWVRSKPAPMYDYLEAADLFDVNPAGARTRDGGYWIVGPDTYLDGPLAVTIGAGATTTVVPTSSTRPTNYFANYSAGFIRFTSGPLAGVSAAITSNTSAGVVTLTSPLSSAPAAGDTATLLSNRASAATDAVHPSMTDLAAPFGGDFYIRDALRTKIDGWSS